MQFIGIFILFASLHHQSAFGIDLNRFMAGIQPHSEAFSEDSIIEEHLNATDSNSKLDWNSTEFQNSSISETITNTTLTEIDQTNFTMTTGQPTQTTAQSTEYMVSSSTAIITSPSYNESRSSNSSLGESSSTGIVPSSTESDGEEPEGVARGKPTVIETVMNATAPKPETVFDRALHIINDTYTLSILLPIVAGVVFATTILLTIALCRCLRRSCRRSRLRRKILPDSVKNLRPSDRARLLAESSDEEF